MIWIIIIAFGLLSFIASQRLKNKFKKYSKIPLAAGVSGAEAAAKMLHDHKIYDVEITCVPGRLTDHYNPSNKTVNLSESVYHGRNAAAVAIAAHEVGHAVQHANAYSMLAFRSMMVPVQNISSTILNVIFFLMIFGVFLLNVFPMSVALLIIIGCYAVTTLFSFITLPVEIDASKRALAWVESSRVVNAEEYAMSKDALKWAALTYVIAAIGSLAMLSYYVLQFIGMDD